MREKMKAAAVGSGHVGRWLAVLLVQYCSDQDIPGSKLSCFLARAGRIFAFVAEIGSGIWLRHDTAPWLETPTYLSISKLHSLRLRDK